MRVKVDNPVLNGAFNFFRRSGLLDTWLGRVLYRGVYGLYKRYYEDPYHGLIKSNPELFTNGHILDVGANIGYTAREFSSVLTPGFKVHAFEPAPDNFKQLLETTQSVGPDKIIPICAAVGAAKGELDLWLNPDNPVDHRVLTPQFHQAIKNENINKEKVKLWSLDEYAIQEGILEKISFIKIDVQGYEIEVLRGMTHILAKNPKVSVSLEYCQELMLLLGPTPESTLDILTSAGFKCYRIKNHRALIQIKEQEFVSLNQVPYTDLLFTRDEIK